MLETYSISAWESRLAEILIEILLLNASALSDNSIKFVDFMDFTMGVPNETALLWNEAWVTFTQFRSHLLKGKYQYLIRFRWKPIRIHHVTAVKFSPYTWAGWIGNLYNEEKELFAYVTYIDKGSWFANKSALHLFWSEQTETLGPWIVSFKG